MTTRKAGFFFSGGYAGTGATISHFRFESVQFPVFSRGANEVTVSHNVMIAPVQGVTNWMGDGWNITNNEIVDLQAVNGGGIGIVVGNRVDTIVVQDNVVAHNKISGSLYCGDGEYGGYNGSGIALYSDARYGSTGGEISYNRVLKNKVSLLGACELVGIIAFELTDTRDVLSPVFIHDNAIGFNHFRGTAAQIALTPETLDNPVNAISRNLGENRGHGLHPNVFGPE